MYLGIDLGTSSVKVLLVDERQAVRAQCSVELDVSRPRPLWAEQDPDAWWSAVNQAMATIRTSHSAELGAVRGIGLAGQMHGATLVDRVGRVLRPAILWNDGRSLAECAELERREPEARDITGNQAMPGFTAPKLLWIAHHEPEIFSDIAHVLLPKDYLRLRMTGVLASDLSDSSGTLWLDVGRRRWSDRMLSATGLTERMMPELFEGWSPTGILLPDISNSWGVPQTTLVAAGAGDNAASAIGIGAVNDGDGLISIGTSGVTLEVEAAFRPDPARAVHVICHALPGRWVRMAVMLSAAASLDWIARVTGGANEEELLVEAETAGQTSDDLFFLPYLTGERTPHNDPNATGAFIGLTQATSRGDLVRAVLEGVALGLADGHSALHPEYPPNKPLAAVGGGTRSRFWMRLIADALERRLLCSPGSNFGAAFGAARLARIAAGDGTVLEVCKAPADAELVEPDPGASMRAKERLNYFRALYPLTQN